MKPCSKQCAPASKGLKFLIVLTKRPTSSPARSKPRCCPFTRLQAGGGEVKMFSALKKQGVDEVLAQLLWQWRTRAPAWDGACQREVPNLPASPQAADENPSTE